MNNSKLPAGNALGVQHKNCPKEMPEDCPDTRNSKVFNIIDDLSDYGCNIDACDPWIDAICSILDTKFPIKINKIIQNSKLNIQNYKDLMVFVEDRAGHDRRYAIDATKLENEFGWKADENFNSGIIKTIDWYLKKYGSDI